MANSKHSNGTDKGIHTPSSINHKPSKITPFCQLFRELKTQEEKDILYEQVEPLRDEYRDDLCLSILAYLKFGIPRVFDNQLMQVIYQAYIELLDRNRKRLE